MCTVDRKYMNPITLEAEMFVQNLESLSKKYNQIDGVLVASLEKLMEAIETFLDANSSVVSTENLKLLECKNINHITKIYYCKRCKMDLGKSAEQATHHIIGKCVCNGQNISGNKIDQSEQALHREELKEEKKQRRENNRKEKFNQRTKLNKKVVALLTGDVNKFFEDNIQIATKLKCLPDYDIIEKDLINAITCYFADQNVKIYRFGSRISGIGSRESDLDIYIDIGERFNVYGTRGDKQIIAQLRQIARSLSTNKSKWKHAEKVENARVPILRVLHASTNIECDINLSNSLGLINTNFLEYIFNIQPIARLICLFMKKWAFHTKLNNDIKTYSIVLMVLFYLQTLDVVPSMEMLQKNVSQQSTIGPWVPTFATLTLKDLNIQLKPLDELNVLKLIRGFFTFYTNFNYKDMVISPYLGKAVKKADFEKLMPDRYTNYVSNPDNSALALDTLIVVQDPIELNHNTTKGVRDYLFEIFRSLLAKSLAVTEESSNKK